MIIPKKGNNKECSNHWTIALISHARKVILKILHAAAAKSLQSCLALCDPIDGSPPGSSIPGILQARRLQHYANQELPDVQAGFRKGRGTRDEIANICWIIQKARELKKKSTSVSSAMPKALIVWIIINCGKLLKR